MSSRQDAAATVQLSSLRNSVDATHERNIIFRTANSATAVAPAVDIPSNLRGRYWRILCVGANAQFGFVRQGDTTPAITYNATCAMGTGAVAAAPTFVDSIPDHIFCPPDAIRYTFINSNGTAGGFTEACVSGERTS
jgi:hypothetical protein